MNRESKTAKAPNRFAGISAESIPEIGQEAGVARESFADAESKSGNLEMVVCRLKSAGGERGLRLRIGGASMLACPNGSLNDLKRIVVGLANEAGLTVFECVGRTFLPVYSDSGNPVAAVEAIVYDPADAGVMRLVEEGRLNELPVSTAKWVDGAWAFEVERGVVCI